jgi:hypothetical protein
MFQVVLSNSILTLEMKEVCTQLKQYVTLYIRLLIDRRKKDPNFEDIILFNSKLFDKINLKQCHFGDYIIQFTDFTIS